MRKSLLVTQDFPPAHGGVAKYYSQLCANYPADCITVLAPPVEGEMSPVEPKSYQVLRRPFFSTRAWVWPRWLPLLGLILKTVRQTKADVIQVGQVLPVGAAVFLATRVLRIPYIVFTHGLDIALPQSNARKRQTMMKVLHGAGRVVANSQFTKAELVRLGVPAEKIEVVTPGCDLIDRQPDEADTRRLHSMWRTEERFILLTVARLEERKGHDQVIEACRRLVKDIPELTYLIVGDGPYRNHLEQLAERSGISKHIHFIGSVPTSQLPAYYSLADAFIMPARQLPNRDVEGFGIVYLEANAFGKAVIGGRSGGVSEAVIDGQTGLLVNPTNADDVARAILTLARDPELRRKLGEQGRRRVQEKFRWQQRAEAVRELIERL